MQSATSIETQDRPGIVTTAEAAAMLDVKPKTVSMLVARGVLHPLRPGKNGRQQHTFYRAEVEHWVDKRRRYANTLMLMPPPPLPPLAPLLPPAEPTTPPHAQGEVLRAVAVSVVTIGALILVYKLTEGGDPVERAMLMGGIASLALLILTEWQKHGRINAAERHRLEILARRAEADPESFIEELERLLATAA